MGWATVRGGRVPCGLVEFLSARGAAERADLDDKTIRNALNAGELHGERGPRGEWRIPSAEFSRWLDWRATRHNRTDVPRTADAEPTAEAIIPPSAPVDAAPHLSAALAALERELERKEQDKARLTADLARERDERDAERARLLADLDRERQERAEAVEEARRLRLLPVHVPRPAEPPRPRRWWQLWRGTAD